ncbi:MAG: ABC transporter ATP-binding protein [Acidimicrobiales bacterium]
MLELANVTAGYGTSTVLNRLSIAVPQGSIVALLGPNGAGKTTTLRVASGLLRPTSGRILFDGHDITHTGSHQRTRLGLSLVPEARGIFKGLTVRENLALQARGRRRDDVIAAAASAFPVLGNRLDQAAGTLSGGEQQMLALARTYVSQPRLALLDEVSFGLAPKIVDEIFLFLRRLADEGASLLLVEQYVQKALALADFVYVVRKGSVAFVGEPSEIDAASIHEAYLGPAA